MAVCEIDPKSIVADEDAVPRVLQDAMLDVAPRFGINVAEDDVGWGKTVRVYDEFDFAQVVGEQPGQLRDALLDSFQRLLEARSTCKADHSLSRRAVEAWITFNKRLRPFGGPYAGIFDVPTGDAALAAYKQAEHDICFRHRDLGSRGRRGAPWSFRVLDDLGFEGDNRVLAVLSLGHGGIWRVDARELTDEAEFALKKAKMFVMETHDDSVSVGPAGP